MSSYVKATNFATKDTLPTGDANKIVKGTEIDNEFTAIAGAITSKADLASPTFTGTPAAPTAAAGTNTTQVASTAFVFAERTNTATLTNKTLTSPTINTPTISTPAITGGTITGITDLTVADGGTGASTFTANSVVLGNGTSALNGNVVAPSTSGNVLTSNGTTWTSAALPTVVTSLNGQTGAITNTDVGVIGSYISAIVGLSAPNVQGSGDLTTTYSVNNTIAGTSLRYGYTNTDGIGIHARFYKATGSAQGPSYTGGGTALTGTWRGMSYATIRGSDDGGYSYYWSPGLWVRIS